MDAETQKRLEQYARERKDELSDDTRTVLNERDALLSALVAMRSWAIPGMDWTDEIGQQLLANADAAIAAANNSAPQDNTSLYIEELCKEVRTLTHQRDALRLAVEVLSSITPDKSEEDHTATLQELPSTLDATTVELTKNILDATRMLEDLQKAGLIDGEAWYLRENVARWAAVELSKRWRRNGR